MKNLEKEYKEQISLDTPDLWSRIEAGIDEYEAAKKSDASAPVTKSPEPPSKSNILTFRTRKIINTVTRITAAAVCLIVVALTIGIAKTNRKESTAPASEVSFVEHHKKADNAAATPSPATEVCEEAEATDVADAAEHYNDIAYESDTMPTLDVNSESSKKYESDASSAGLAESSDIADDDLDTLKAALESIGFTQVSGLVTNGKLSLVESLTRGLDKFPNGSYTASFTDDETGSECIVIYRDKDGAVDILAVTKADETGSFLYTKPAE